MAERVAPGWLPAALRSDLFLAVALTGACLVELLARSEQAVSPQAAIVVVALGAPLAARRSHPLPAICIEAVVFLTAAALDLAGTFPPDLELAFAAVLGYSCGSRLSRRTGLLGVSGLLVALQVGVGFSEFPNFELAFVTLGPWWAGRQVLRRRRLVSELQVRTRELESEEETFVALSVRRERARIARELHDIVSHHLAVMVIQAGAGRLADGAHAEQAGERLATIGDSGRQALGEMARLLDMLQADGGGDRLAQLLQRARASGSNVHVVTLPAQLRLPPAVEEDAYRVIQEGLTNAMKHAPGARVDLRIAMHEGDVLIELRSGAAAQASELAASGSGLGLQGMRERIATLDGSLDAGPDADGGWLLRARLPSPRSAGAE
ncbi:MAG: histidine kinase [Solirubrobacteraceae bacterium]